MRSRYSKLMDITKTLADAEERYYMAQGAYTDDFDSLDISLSGVKEGTKAWLLDDKDNTWCYIFTPYYIACSNTSSLNNAYSIYFKKGPSYFRNQMCYSYGASDDKYARLCSDIAGDAVGSTASCPTSSRGGASNCYFVKIIL